MLYPRQPIVLMIDVDNISYKVFKKTVTLTGFTPIQLESCQGFKYLHSENVAAVVLDVEMCRNAFQTLAQIEELFPNSALIVLTGPGENVQARFAVRLGAKHVVTKPCDRKELDRILRFIAEHGAASCPATKARATPISFQGPTLAEIERRALLAAVRAAGGDNLRAARMLGIGKTTLCRKLKQYSYSRAAHRLPHDVFKSAAAKLLAGCVFPFKESIGNQTWGVWGPRPRFPPNSLTRCCARFCTGIPRVWRRVYRVPVSALSIGSREEGTNLRGVPTRLSLSPCLTTPQPGARENN